MRDKKWKCSVTLRLAWNPDKARKEYKALLSWGGKYGHIYMTAGNIRKNNVMIAVMKFALKNNLEVTNVIQ